MYKIGELGEKVGLAPSAVRYYIQKGLLKPAGRTAGGHRFFNEASVYRLRQIEKLKKQRLTLDEIRETLGGVVNENHRSG